MPSAPLNLGSLTYSLLACWLPACSLLSYSLPALAGCEDKNVIVTQQSFKNGIRYVAELHNALEVTLDINCEKFSNATASSRLPATIALSGPGTREILRFTQRDQNEKWYVGPWMKHWRYGLPNQSKTDPNYVYELPFEKNKRFKVNQSYQGKHSHNQGSESEFAIDFGMPEGTTVCAARAGKVIVIRVDSTQGGDNRELYEDCANAVIVRHSDGTYGSYIHLRPKSALVKLGQTVTAGTPLAQSGNTGWSTTPHLHFEVYRVVSGKQLFTVPVKFRTSEGIRDRLLEGEFYGSEALAMEKD